MAVMVTCLYRLVDSCQVDISAIVSIDHSHHSPCRHDADTHTYVWDLSFHTKHGLSTSPTQHNNHQIRQQQKQYIIVIIIDQQATIIYHLSSIIIEQHHHHGSAKAPLQQICDIYGAEIEYEKGVGCLQIV